jgi:hypothetical protein
MYQAATNKIKEGLSPVAKFLSLNFHTRFFSALLWGRLRPTERTGRNFSSVVELHVLFVICFILLVIGIPIALSNKLVIGWVVGGIGATGISALLINSIFSREAPPSYDNFLIGVFFFFVILGLTAGIFAGSLEHSRSLGLLVGVAGLIAGYLLGILAGLWLQYLGWLASTVNVLAWFAVLGMFFVDLVLLSGSLFG